MNTSSLTPLRMFGLAAVCSVFIEVWSFVGLNHSSVRVALWVAIVLLAIVLAWRQPMLALSLVVIELVLGGKGYLASVSSIGGQGMSMRLGIFLAVFVVWALRALRTRQIWGTQRPFRWFWLGMIGIVAWSVIVGILHHNGIRAVYLDANAFLFLGLVPAFGWLKNRDELYRIIGALGGALVVVAFETGFAQVLFNHIAVGTVWNFFHWIHVTGVGEVTMISSNLFRIFFRSHVYGLLAFAVGIGLSMRELKNHTWMWRGTAAAGLFVTIISLSRSFWLGGAVGLIAGVLAVVSTPTLRHDWKKLFVNVGIPVLLGILAFQWALNFPGLWGGHPNANLLQARLDVQTESAASSRRELLPVITKAIFQHPVVGSGLGTSLTFKTLDPRVNITKNPTGTNYTSTAFELGWHAFAMQFGLPLFALYVGMLGWFFWIGWRKIRTSADERWPLLGFWVAGVALCGVHLTTPYLNHPLGLGILMLIACAFALVPDQTHAER